MGFWGFKLSGFRVSSYWGLGLQVIGVWGFKLSGFGVSSYWGLGFGDEVQVVYTPPKSSIQLLN